MEKDNDQKKSRETQHRIREKLKDLGLDRRNFLKFSGASAVGGLGALFLPGVSKAAAKSQSFNDMASNGQTVSVLPAWKPYPYEVIGMPVLDAGVPEGFFTYLMNYDKILPIYCGAFYISGVKDKHIIVDTGPTKKDFTDKGYPCEEIMPLAEQLQKMVGLTPKDIDIVLYTHLHHDHNPLASTYTNAKHVVQKTEWNMLHNPPACYRHLLNPEYMTGVTPTFVHGDVVNLFPGISLLYTPGHTSGGQSVVVDTKMGRVIICGTCCEEANFDPPDSLKQFWPDVIVPGLHIDSQQAYESLVRIKSEADYIITPHDKKHYDRGVCPSDKWPKLGTRKEQYKMYQSS